MKKLFLGLVAGVLSSATPLALATPVACAAVSASINYMLVDSSYVASCTSSGVGNIGNGDNDVFLLDPAAQAIAGLRLVGTNNSNPFTTTDGPGGLGSTGTFSLAGNPWQDHSALYLGFKFGTGGSADEWFVYRLQQNVVAGDWRFMEADRPGGQGLSHITLYGVPDGGRVPEPGSLALAGLALLAGAAVRRRRG